MDDAVSARIPVPAAPLFLLATIRPRAEHREQARAQLESMRQASLTEPGCVFMHLTQPQDDADSWVMLEMFASREAWDDHMRQPYNTQGNQILEPWLRAPTDLRLLDDASPELREGLVELTDSRA